MGETENEQKGIKISKSNECREQASAGEGERMTGVHLRRGRSGNGLATLAETWMEAGALSSYLHTGTMVTEGGRGLQALTEDQTDLPRP